MPIKKKRDPEVTALIVTMEKRGWNIERLAKEIGMALRTVYNQFSNDFSSKEARIRVNKKFAETNGGKWAPVIIFTEGVGLQKGKENDFI